MPYRFARERLDYADFASGRVFHSLPGRTGFPVRLADEIFQRCLAIRAAHGQHEPATLYDPCCGGGALLCTLAYQHWPDLRQVIASDADPDAVALATRNLALLTPAGLAERRRGIESRHQEFGKVSHAEALASVDRLSTQLSEHLQSHTLPTRGFVANALDGEALRSQIGSGAVDLVITDVPYGQHSAWIRNPGADRSENLIWHLLEALRPILAPRAMLAIVSDKGQRARHERYSQVGRLQIGKRRASFLTPTP
jgi:hypothetical protein